MILSQFINFRNNYDILKLKRGIDLDGELRELEDEIGSQSSSCLCSLHPLSLTVLLSY